MKLSFKNVVMTFLTFVLCFFVVGCKDNGGTKDDDKKGFNEANYTLDQEYEFSEELDLVKAKDALTNANNNLNVKKSYLYTQTLNGTSEESYKCSGVTKIDVTGENPKASMELTGDLQFAFYVTDSKAYFNMNGDKRYTDIKGDLSDLVGNASQAVGAFVSFNPDDINETNLKQAGIDKFGATVITYQVNDNATATIVIYDGNIMKVLYSNLDQMEYISVYDYETPVTITFPDDLDTYIKK